MRHLLGRLFAAVACAPTLTKRQRCTNLPRGVAQPRTSRIALAGLLGVLLIGCEGESERATSTPDAAPTMTVPATTVAP